VTSFAFDEGTKTDNAFSRSVIDQRQRDERQMQSNVAAAEMMGVGMANATTDGGKQVDLTLFGIEPGSFLEPARSEGAALARSEGAALGDTDGIVVSSTAEQLSALDFKTASVVAVQAKAGTKLALSAGDEAAGTSSKLLNDAFNASPGYEAETMTISMIQVFLYAICALVVGAFFRVWTIQRNHEIAVLRAIGASTGYLLRDGVVQAAILLVGFTALGCRSRPWTRRSYAGRHAVRT
jgi:putative ABC transport system permease protein